MDSGLLISFLAIDLLLVCVPGADWAYAISAGLRDRSPMPAVAGLVTGYALHTVLAVAGLAVLVASEPGLLTALTAAGAAYLVWLGWGCCAGRVRRGRPRRTWRRARPGSSCAVPRSAA